MDAWKSFATSLSGAAATAAASAAPVGSRLSKQWGHLSQQARERLGTVDDVTELPGEYRALEARVDGLRTAHAAVARVVKVHETEAYDCPVNLQESVSEASRSLASTVGTWAAQARGAPSTQQSAPPPHRTLPHTLSRAAASAAVDVQPSSLPASQNEEPETIQALTQALQALSLSANSVGNARLEQDQLIVQNFLTPWLAFGNQIQLATKARQAVSEARLELDAAKQTLKSLEAAAPGTNDATRLQKAQTDVENDEDALVAATEDAIGLMKNVLENPEPVRMLGVLLQMYVASVCVR